MSNLADERQEIRLNHAELVSPDEHNAIIGLAWDAYMQIAAQLEPKVLASLFTEHAIDAIVPLYVRSEETETGQHIRGWCRRWGFRQEYAFNPAWNTLNKAKKARGEGRPLPDEFVCRWSGQLYDRWREQTNGEKELGSIATFLHPHDAGDLNPDGAPHPFPELAGRLLSHYHFLSIGGNGIRRIPQKDVARMGTQVVLNLPIFYWEPTAETRAEARTRILVEVAEILDTDLEKIEQAHRNQGYVNPPEKRAEKHLEWLFRYQVLRDNKQVIADADGVRRSTVHKAVLGAARFLGMRELRKEPGGRPTGQRDSRPRWRAKPMT